MPASSSVNSPASTASKNLMSQFARCQRRAAALRHDPVADRAGIATGLLEQIVAGTERIEHHAAIGHQVFTAFLGKPDRIREHFERVGFGEIGNAVEFALLDQPRDQQFRLALERVAQCLDRRGRQDPRQHRAGAGVQRRIGLQDNAGRPPWRLFTEIA
jgi:hypothetical protein